MSDKSSTESYQALLQQYLQLCNEALAANKDRFPYAQIWQAAEQALRDGKVEFALVDDAPKARLCVALSDAHIECVENGAGDEDVPVQRISADYIQTILASREDVIANPSLIDWNWMKMVKPAP